MSLPGKLPVVGRAELIAGLTDKEPQTRVQS